MAPPLDKKGLQNMLVTLNQIVDALDNHIDEANEREEAEYDGNIHSAHLDQARSDVKMARNQIRHVLDHS